MVPLLLLLLATGPGAAPTRESKVATPGDTVPLERFAARVRHLADSARAPGGAAVVLPGAGAAPLIVPFGTADGSRRVTAATAFRIASVSKVFTAAAIARMVAAGRMALDTDMRPGHPWLGERAPGREPVTLRQLLTHTAGFDDRFVGMFARTPADVMPLSAYLAGHMPRRTTPAGRSTRYSNHGVALAGLLLEEASGRPFAEAVDSLVLAPAGMRSSTFAQPIPDGILAHLALARPCADGSCDPLPVDYRQAPPAGGMVTTPEDMARFLTTIIGSDTLGEATALLFAKAWSPGAGLPGIALALQEQTVAGHRGLVHSGSSSGYLSLLVLIPDRGAGLFLVTTGGSPRLGAWMLDAFTALLSTGRPQEPRPGALARAEAEAYGGAYLLGRAPRASYEKFPARFLFTSHVGVDSAGFLTRTEGGIRRRYGQVSPDLFQEVDGWGRLGFARDGGGRIIGLEAADLFNGARFPASYTRLAWYESPGFLNEFLSWIVAGPVLVLVGWLAAWAWRLVRRPKSRGVQATVRGRGLILAFGVATLFAIVVFAFGFVARFNAMASGRPGALVYGLPPALAGLLWLPWVIVAGTALLVPACWRLWRSRSAEWPDRLLLTTITLSGVLFTTVMVQFSLLPPTP